MKGPRIIASRFASLITVTTLLAGLTGVALAPAQSPGPAPEPHLLLVPATPEGTVALARTDARTVARYGSFSLVEAAGADADRLRRAGADRRDDMRTVTTAAGRIDPSSDRRSLAGKEAPERDEALALVQFIGPPKEAWLGRLHATGARIVTYQAQNAYVVHARGEAVDRLAALQGADPAVRAVSVLTAADKLEDDSSRSGVFAVTTVSGDAGDEARDQAARAGSITGAAVTVGALRTDFRALSAAEAAELARQPGVVAVEAYAEPELTDERGAQIVAGNLTGAFAPSGPAYLGWLVQPERIPSQATFDFAIDVTDGGLDTGVDPPAHPDFRVLGSSGNPDRVAYMANYTGDSDARDCSGHGTNVASIATGYNSSTGAANEDGAGFNHGLGVAPFARVGGSKIFECDGGFSNSWTPARLASAAYARGARISNNSWGTGGPSAWGDYDVRSAAYDQVVRDQQMVEVFSAGNDGDGNPGFFDEGYGTISEEGSAKNVITVGAAEGVRASGTDGCGTANAAADSARDIVGFSSRGPTDDGRLKPDLVAPGTHITGAAPQHAGYTGTGTCNKFFTGTTLYSLVSGTSQATPQVSGAAALLRSWYRRTQAVDPSPALIKALLVNTATDLAGGQNGKGDTIAAGPNTDQGWGRVNVGNAFAAVTREYRDQLPADLLGASGESVVRSYAVQDPAKPVKVTLVWTDAPGPTTGNPVVNNLDLIVDARGRTYKGNVFADGVSRTGGSADPRNNVETVHLAPGSTGRFAVTVQGTAIGGDGVPGGDGTDQDFALVVSNADEQPAPVLVHQSTAIDDSGPGGDSDGVLESDEVVQLAEQVRNAGDVSANGLSATLTAGTPNLTVTQGTSLYPPLDPGASGANEDLFAADLANEASCGVDVPAILAIASTSPADTHTIPLLLPTGGPGASQTDSASGAAVPRAIPDDSAAGVSSSVFVAERGRIRDLDVRIPGDAGNPGLDHGWVGDLVIDLIGPDGTRVRLVEHPGGPDNGGKDFGGTIFDDEADSNIAAGTAPYTGRFRPQNDQLSRFDGKSRRGTWTLRVRDLFEGDEGTLAAWGVTSQKALCDIDTTPPETTFDQVPAPRVNQTSATFEFSSPTDPGGAFECKLDGAAYEPCSSPRSLTGLTEGSHTFRVRAIDGSDNEDASPAQHSWTVDLTPPDTTITAGPPAGGFTSSTSASFEFGSSEAAQGFECRLDGGSFSPCTSPQPQVYSGLPNGSHTFAVRARDVAQNLDPTPATRTWTVDTAAPAPAVTSPAEGSATPDRTPLVRGTAGTAPGDASSVQVRVFAGVGVGGTPLESHPVPRDAGGAWSVTVGHGSSLTPGRYTIEVRQSDAAGNPPGTATSTFTVTEDFAAPIVSVSTPGSGSTVTDATPGLAGRAGTAVGDEAEVIVELFAGTLVGGMPAQTLIVPSDAASGAWSAVPAPLTEGTWTVRARQLDSAGNVGMSAPSTFTVDLPGGPPPPAPSFLIAPAEDRLADVVAGRLTVLAACASACEARARLTVSARAARRLGVGSRSVALGSGVKRLAQAGTAAVRVRLGRRARAALRGEEAATATLRVRVSESAGRLSLNRAVSLGRGAGLRQIVRRGVRLWAVCSERCPVSGALTVSARTARRIGLRPRGSARMRVASGRVSAPARAPARLTLKVPRGARTALRNASRVRALLETVAGPGAGPKRAAKRSLTLRR